MNYFPLLAGRIVLSNKIRNLRKYSVVFLRHFRKERYLADPLFKSVGKCLMIYFILIQFVVVVVLV